MNELVLGALIGGAVIGLSTAFFSSKTGRALRRELVDKCQDIGDTVEDAIGTLSEKAQNIKDNFTGDAEDFRKKASKKAKKAVNYVVQEVSHVASSNHTDLRIGLLAGALFAGLVSLGVTALVKRRASQASHSVSSGVGHYLTELKGIVEKVADAVQEHVPDNEEEVTESPLRNAIDLAMSGVKFWQAVTRKNG